MKSSARVYIGAVIALMALYGQAKAGRIWFAQDWEDGNGKAEKGKEVLNNNGCSCQLGKNCIYEVQGAVTNRAIGSTKALKHKITNCDERAEVGIYYGQMFKGSENWVVYSIYFPKGWGPGAIVQQGGGSTLAREKRNQRKARFKCNKAASGGKSLDHGPPFSYMTYKPGTFNYNLYPYESSRNGVDTYGCKRFKWSGSDNTWHTYVFHFTASNKPHPYQIWHNGKLVVDVTVPIWGPECLLMANWKCGMYLGDPGKGNRTCYTDDMYAGSGYANVDDFLNDTPYGKNPTGLIPCRSHNNRFGACTPRSREWVLTTIAGETVLKFGAGGSTMHDLSPFSSVHGVYFLRIAGSTKSNARMVIVP